MNAAKPPVVRLGRALTIRQFISRMGIQERERTYDDQATADLGEAMKVLPTAMQFVMRKNRSAEAMARVKVTLPVEAIEDACTRGGDPNAISEADVTALMDAMPIWRSISKDKYSAGFPDAARVFTALVKAGWRYPPDFIPRIVEQVFRAYVYYTESADQAEKEVYEDARRWREHCTATKVKRRRKERPPHDRSEG